MELPEEDGYEYKSGEKQNCKNNWNVPCLFNQLLQMKGQG